MIGKLLFILFLLVLQTGCGSKMSALAVEPEPGCTISITALKYSKSEQRFTGVITIENHAESFVRVSNRELFLYCGSDSARTFVKLPGSWQIDDGLINILKGKTVTFQTYWPLKNGATCPSPTARYIKLINRSETEE
jgi:hypothetical protein